MPNPATVLIGWVIPAGFTAIVVRGARNLRRGRRSPKRGGPPFPFFAFPLFLLFVPICFVSSKASRLPTGGLWAFWAKI